MQHLNLTGLDAIASREANLRKAISLRDKADTLVNRLTTEILVLSSEELCPDTFRRPQREISMIDNPVID